MSKRSASEWLKEPLEDLISHVDNSRNESEIPFFQSVLSARTQIASEKQTRIMIVLSAIVAITSIASVWLSLSSDLKNRERIESNVTHLNRHSQDLTKLSKEIKRLETENTKLGQELTKLQSKSKHRDANDNVQN